MTRSGDKRTPQESFASFLGWLDSLGALGLDGGDLTEIGLKSGNLVVDDVRSGHQSKFENIRVSLTRPHSGELEFALGSEDAARPWLVHATVKPIGSGVRAVSFDARSVSLRDLLLALRVDCSNFEADGSISATMRGRGRVGRHAADRERPLHDRRRLDQRSDERGRRMFRSTARR